MFQDYEAKTDCWRECDKRNKHIGKHHVMRWRPLWTQGNGWFPALRPAR